MVHPASAQAKTMAAIMFDFEFLTKQRLTSFKVISAICNHH